MNFDMKSNMFNVKEEKQKKNSGKLLRAGAFILAGVLAWQVITPPMARVIGALAEENATLSKIYGILSDSLGELETAQDYYEAANISIGKGEYENALQQLKAARSLLTTAEADHLDAADSQEQTKVEKMQALSEEDTQLLAEIWLKTASVYILTGSLEDAQTALNEALEMDSTSAQALLLRAQLCIENADYDAAIADLQAYLELNSTDVATRQTLAQLLESTEDYMGANAQYETLYAQLPEDEAFKLNALRCLFLNGNYEEAVAGFDDYKLRHADDESDSYGGIADFLRAASLMQMGDYAAAAEGFELAIAAGYDQVGCLEQITLCCFENGEYEKVISTGEALFAIEDAAVSAPAMVYQRMGISAMRLGDYEGALNSMDKAAEIDAQLEGNEYYRGVCLLSLQRTQEAVEAFTASIEYGYLPQFCYYNRGVCYVDLLEYEKAVDDMAMTLEAGDDADLIAAAKDILWQLAEYFNQIESAPSADADVEATDEASIPIDEPIVE